MTTRLARFRTSSPFLDAVDVLAVFPLFAWHTLLPPLWCSPGFLLFFFNRRTSSSSFLSSSLEVQYTNNLSDIFVCLSLSISMYERISSVYVYISVARLISKTAFRGLGPLFLLLFFKVLLSEIYDSMLHSPHQHFPQSELYSLRLRSVVFHLSIRSNVHLLAMLNQIFRWCFYRLVLS